MELKTYFKKAVGLLMAFCLMLLCACSASVQKKPFELKDITMDQLETMMDDRETFVLLVERDNCPYCMALHEYLDQTEADHEDLIVYQLDTSDYHMVREKEGDNTLISDTENGQAFLKLFPYFLYTPSLYQIKDGVPVQAGIGYDDSNGSVCLWDVDSTIDWTTAKPINVWGFIKDGQGSAADSSQNTSAQENPKESDNSNN